MQTNTNKLLAGALVAGMVLASTSAYATTIGTGSVVGSGALTSNVDWNDTYTSNSATGTVNGIVVTAKVKPSLNMVITGSGVIDLGEVDPTAYSSGSVDIEVGTNAINGASVTARSTNGGLQNASDATQFINSATTGADPVADSYMYSSAIVGAVDSAFGTFTQSAMAAVEVDDNTTAHPIYTSNKPQALAGTDDFSFTVAAQPDAQTPAGEYNDVVVLTVTGNF
ncbi:MAG: hypothetical protein WAW59_00305 [Patescibacteria group bacterium]